MTATPALDATLSPRTRLIVGLIVTVAGAALAVAGVASTWFTVHAAGATIELPDVGRAEIPGEAVSLAGTDVGGGVAILVVGALLASGLAALTGRRARVALLASVVVLSVGAIVFAVMTGPADAAAAAPRTITAEQRQVTASVGRAVTMTGAGLAAIGAALSMTVAGRVARVRMPEGAPDAQAQP